ncbi:MFS transporter [Dehalococcoidia bacterium]|nr:MFS transporter [Dehalococcoidia bacterium]
MNQTPSSDTNTTANQGMEHDAIIRPWASLLIRDYRLIWLAGIFSASSGQMKQVINLYQVYKLSGSPFQLGLTGVFMAIPFIVFGLIGGAMADVFDRKKIILTTQVLNIAPPLTLGILTATGVVQVWHIYMLTAFNSFAGALGGPAQMAMIPRLVPKDHLMNAVVLNTAGMHWTGLLGPILAGFLIDFLGVDGAYVAAAILMAPAITAIITMRTSGKPNIPNARISLWSLWQGIHFIWVERIILSLFLLDFGAILVGFYRPLLPVFASDIYNVGASGLGILYSAPAMGAAGGTLVLLLAGDVKRKGAMAVVTTVFFGCGLVLLGVSPWFWMGILATGLLGLTDAFSVTIRRSTVQLLSPDHMLGRASSMLRVFSMSTNALGAIVAGAAAAWLGAPNALILGGGMCILIVLSITLSIPQLWRYRSP